MMQYFLIGIITFLMIIIFLQNMRYINMKFLLNRTNDINNSMIKISEELNNFKDINVLYNELLSQTINLINGAECGSILIYNKEKDYMDYKACIGHDLEALSIIHLKKEELYLYDTTGLQRPAIIKNPLLFDKSRLEKQKFEGLVNSKSLGIKVSLSAPLYINGEFYGLISVDNNLKEDAFDKNDIKLIGYICRELEIAIKNVTLMNELKQILMIDKLTNIYNRRYFEEIMGNLFNSSEINNKSFTLVMIDLDDFKLINDIYGHKVGDEFLKYFASALKANIRDVDMAVRYAGDEFILLLSNSNKYEAQRVIERIRESISNFPYENIKLDFSSGICEYTNYMNLDKIVTNADNNMYKEKRSKKSMLKMPS